MMILSLERRILLAFCILGLVWVATEREHSWQSSWLEPGVAYLEPIRAHR